MRVTSRTTTAAARRVMAIVAVIALSAATATAATAQDLGSEVLTPGEYSGWVTIGFVGLVFETSDGRVVVTGGYDGGFSATVTPEETVDGDLLLDGSWDAQVSTPEGDGTVDGRATIDGSLTGDTRRLTAVGTDTTTATARFAGLSFPIDNTSPIPPISFDVTGANCAEMLGDWELGLETVIGAIGYSNPAVTTGTFYGINTSRSEQREQVQDFFDTYRSEGSEALSSVDLTGLPPILTDIRSFVQQYDSTPPGDFLIPEVAFELVDSAAELSERARNLDPCDRDLLGDNFDEKKSDATLPTQVVREVIRQMEAQESYGDFEGPQMRELATRAMEHGLVGPNAVDAPTDAATKGFFQDWVNATAEANVDANNEFSSDSDMVDAVLVGAMLGLTITSPATGETHNPRDTIQKNASALQMMGVDTGVGGS